MTFLPRQLTTAVVSVAAVATMALGLQAADPPDFRPDARFEGSTLTDWDTVGQADWTADQGEIVGRPQAGGSGWLVLDRKFEDLLFSTNVKCAGTCQAGVLLRVEDTGHGGLRGVYVSLTNGDMGTYRVTLDAQGREASRELIGDPPAAGGGGGRGGRGGGAPAAPPTLAAGQWHPIQITIWNDALRRSIGANVPLDAPDTPSYGRIALFAGGSGDVRYRDVAWKDINRVVEEEEQVSDRFTMRQISSMYHGWSASASDINQDGAMDIVSGPFYYLGPSYLERRIYREGRVHNPATEYAGDMVNFTFDFTGDGWPDILASELSGGRPMDLHVNPKGEARKWDEFRVLPTISTEVVLGRDLDGDGKPEMIFGGGGAYNWARPDPANPTAEWVSNRISSEGQRVVGHGIGVGDVNGDGRTDIVTPTGWYEQPAGGITQLPWAFHEASFGGGGGEIGAYDVNGDGLTDVVTSLSAHGWGLAWFEQQRAADGTRTFAEHRILTNLSTMNAGGVAFSEAHASRFADMTGDGVPDFLVGKRYWGHLENYNGPDPYGPAVVYIYRTVRNPAAPGGAEFMPELVHNRSGVGSAFEVADLDGDGQPDIAVAGAYGTHVFLAK
jgi:hypothetical protein